MANLIGYLINRAITYLAITCALLSKCSRPKVVNKLSKYLYHRIPGTEQLSIQYDFWVFQMKKRVSQVLLDLEASTLSLNYHLCGNNTSPIILIPNDLILRFFARIRRKTTAIKHSSHAYLVRIKAYNGNSLVSMHLHCKSNAINHIIYALLLEFAMARIQGIGVKKRKSNISTTKPIYHNMWGDGGWAV